MTTKELAIMSLFEGKLNSKSLLDSYQWFRDEDFKTIDAEEAKGILSKCKKAFYRRKSMKGVEIYSKFVNQHNHVTYSAIVPPNFFMDDQPVMCQVEMDVDDKELLRINFISIYTGEIIQGTYKYD